MKPLISFPCVLPLKVMGANEADFEDLVLSIIQKHATLVAEKTISRRVSRGGRFLSVTVHIQAQSKEQLDAIYGELSAHERVLMLL